MVSRRVQTQASSAPTASWTNQNPVAGTVIASGSTVVVRVSSEPPPAPADVVGETEALAKAQLTRAGFRYSTK